ncbi:MAG: helix-turn-helix domain-containing protein [Pseudolysinimonas sp.]
MEQAKRSYRSPRRDAQAQDTRARLLASARRLFAETGWTRTTLKAVAVDAGVAEPTVYAIFQSKSGLAVALLDAVDSAADLTRLTADLGQPGATPREQILAVAAFERRMYEGAGDLIRLLRDGASLDDDLAAAYQDGVGRSEFGWRRLISNWPAGTLRAGVDAERAVSVALLACSLATFDLLHLERGWPLDQVEQWCGELLLRELIGVS